MMRLIYSGIVVGVVLLATGASVWGQAYQVQQGRLLDASNRLGSGGLNYARPPYNFNAGNRIVTGNVAGGAGFRGFSPIRDPNSLFLGGSLLDPNSLAALSTTSRLSTSALPSDQLNAFRRDSFNLWDYRTQSYGLRGGIAGYLPYYSSSSTVTNTGAIISGRNRIGTSQVVNSYKLLGSGVPVRPGDPFAVSGSLVTGGSSLAVPSRLLRSTTGQPVTGKVNNLLLQSQLFGGAVRQVPLTELSSQKIREEALGAATAAPVSVTGPLDLRVRPLGPEDTRVEGSGLLDRRLDRRVETGSTLDRVLERAAADGEWQAGRTGRALSPSGVSTGNGAVSSAQGGLRRSPGGLFGGAGDVFARMREMSSVFPRTRLTSPGSEATVSQAPDVSLVRKFGGPQAVRPAIGDPSITTPSLPPEGSGPQPAELDPALMPIKTFVGTQKSMVNNSLADAESDLQAGKFYRAAETYRFTRSFAPDNPLPVLGNAMALLAAGDYMTSVSGLFEAIRLFESLSLFQIDLKAFVTDLGLLDRRRADLESRLEHSENYRLRFLLGWAEYCSGLEELGLSNMEKAMEASQPEEPASGEESQATREPVGFMDYQTVEVQAVRRFVQALRQRGERSDRPVEIPSN